MPAVGKPYAVGSNLPVLRFLLGLQVVLISYDRKYSRNDEKQCGLNGHHRLPDVEVL